jgi:CMP-N-acetylneuraminic acid synthetase/spore coat polysaccharide biosynthesis predicted glycosyltransferase SpsG
MVDQQARAGREDALLAIVPARAGSQGLVGKNMRLVAGRPLIGHTLEAVRDSGCAERIVVSTDGEDIAAWARLQGFEVIDRPPELTGPEATIAQVAREVAERLAWTGTVGVFQPTSPLRGAEAIRDAVNEFGRRGARSMASAIREPHLYWRQDPGSSAAPEPLFTERVNRQYAGSPILRETGAIQLVGAEHLRETGSMVAPDHVLFETDADAAIDIDSFDELTTARSRAEEGVIVFRLRGEPRTGSGHLTHCLQLAEELADQRLHFMVRDGAGDFVSEALDSRGYAWRVESDLLADLGEIAGDAHPRVLVNDILDTRAEDVLAAKTLGFLVVNIEDLGEGARYADWVVNALYEPGPELSERVASGARWATLRHEFHGLPERQIRRQPEAVLLTFGGTDPSGLSARLATALSRADLGVELRLVLGAGVGEIEDIPGVTIRRSVESMAAEMVAADLVITSAGRTVYEAASCGTPVVAVAQNAREATHVHLGPETGVIFLGIGSLLDDETVVRTTERLLGDAHLREELSERLRSSLDARGAERIGYVIRGLMRGLT